ncbi:unnamed protein product [Durusdinium trenchii]
MSWGPELHLTLVFDSPRRLAPASWTVDRPEGEDVLKFLGFHQSILQALTPHPVTFLAHSRDETCFQRGTVGFRSFRYDMKDPQMGQQEVALFRRALARAAEGGHGAKPRRASTQRLVLMIRRAKGQPRHISNLGQLEASLRRSRSRWVVEGRALESLSLLEQFSLASQADVLVGAHGAGLAWMVAMHPGSAVTELMPPTLPGYIACIETWDHPRNLRHGIYGGLAHTVGQHHICLRGNATALADPFEVDNFRERSFEIPLKVVLRRIHEVYQAFLVKTCAACTQGGAKCFSCLFWKQRSGQINGLW